MNNLSDSLINNGIYDDCGSMSDQAGVETLGVNRFAKLIASHCGLGKTLDIGCGKGLLVGELLKLNVDAHGIDVSATVIALAKQCFSSRFQQATVLSLPFHDDEFESIVSMGCLEYLNPEDVVLALKEIHRVTRRFLLLQVSTTDRNNLHLTVEDRAWWEQCCFESGFRKHPAYYQINDYESLDKDGHQIYILLEKIPQLAQVAYPLEVLAIERDLHMDMLREVGERSDAHVGRYKWAASFVRHGDRVLDAACGLGYGSYTLGQLSEVATVTGVDGSDYAAAYAAANFSIVQNKLSFLQGYLPACLEQFEDGAFDVVISFETLEHVEDPEALLEEFERVLSPGGRIIVSVPNDWSDETGEDPNPFHLHVYTLDKLKSQISRRFIPEALVQQIASGCKLNQPGRPWKRMPRTFRPVAIDISVPPPSEWWLMVGMKNPVSNSLPYRESVYGYSSPPENLLQFERDYNNPWLIRSLLEFHFRATNASVLDNISNQVLLQEEGKVSADAGAALAIQGYQLLESDQTNRVEVEIFLERLEPYIFTLPSSPHLQRWKISHAYLSAQLLKKIGSFDAAIKLLHLVTHADLKLFSPTLGTKAVDAAFEAGMLEAAKGNLVCARNYWKNGVERAYSLLSFPVGEFVGDIENPHEFPSIVAVEFLDSAVRCIKALRWTADEVDMPINRLYSITGENWKGMIRERDEAIAAQEKMLDERWEIMQSMEVMILKRDEAIIASNETIAASNETIAAQTKILEDRLRIRQLIKIAIREKAIEIFGYENVQVVAPVLKKTINGYIRLKKKVGQLFYKGSRK